MHETHASSNFERHPGQTPARVGLVFNRHDVLQHPDHGSQVPKPPGKTITVGRKGANAKSNTPVIIPISKRESWINIFFSYFKHSSCCHSKIYKCIYSFTQINTNCKNTSTMFLFVLHRLYSIQGSPKTARLPHRRGLLYMCHCLSVKGCPRGAEGTTPRELHLPQTSNQTIQPQQKKQQITQHKTTPRILCTVAAMQLDCCKWWPKRVPICAHYLATIVYCKLRAEPKLTEAERRDLEKPQEKKKFTNRAKYWFKNSYNFE